MKRFKKIVLYFFTNLLLLVVVAIGCIYLFRDTIEKHVGQAISNQLATKVHVGSIDLSLFSNFPMVSVDFSAIRAEESKRLTGEPLMELEKFTVTINPFNILRGKYKFDNIILHNGRIVAARNADSANYFIFKKQEKSSQQNGGGSFNLDFKKITLENIQVVYLDAESEDTLSLTVNKVQLSGKFNEQQYLLSTSGSIQPKVVNMGGNRFNLSRPINFATAFMVNNADTSYSFSNTVLTVENLDFVVNGKITGGSKSACKLQLQGKNLGIQQLLQLIPPKYLEGAAEYESQGVLECKLNIEGSMGKGKMPDIQATFNITNGLLGKKGIDVQLKNLNLAGKLDYSKKGDITFSTLKLSQISAEVNAQKVQGRLTLDNFSDPYIEAALQGTFNLQQWQKLFKFKVIKDLEGMLTINLDAEGKVSGFKKATDGVPALFKGTVKAENVKLALNNSVHVYDNISGDLYADNNLLEIKELNGRINGNTLQVSGKAQGLLEYLFNEGKPLEVEGTLSSPHIDIPTLTATGNKPAAAGSQTPVTKVSTNPSATGKTGFSIPANISFRLKSQIGKVTFDKFNAANVTGTIEVHKGVVTLQNLDFETMKGRINLTGNIFSQGQRFVVSADMKATGIDINQLFYQCENFGQQELTSKNIYGKLTTHLQFAAPMDKNMEFDLKRLYTRADLKITGGRLVDYKPMLSLSKFVRVDELQDISFDELQNTIVIEDRKITIPRMEIKNSALNMVAEGTHTFDNYMEYKFSMKLKEVLLAKKASARRPPEGNYEEDKDGITLFISMKGTPDNLKIQYDKKAAVQKMKSNIKNEKNTLSNLLRDEFNIKRAGDKNNNASQDAGSEGDEKEEWETDIPQ